MTKEETIISLEEQAKLLDTSSYEEAIQWCKLKKQIARLKKEKEEHDKR